MARHLFPSGTATGILPHACTLWAPGRHFVPQQGAQGISEQGEILPTFPFPSQFHCFLANRHRVYYLQVSSHTCICFNNMASRSLQKFCLHLCCVATFKSLSHSRAWEVTPAAYTLKTLRGLGFYDRGRGISSILLIKYQLLFVLYSIYCTCKPVRKTPKSLLEPSLAKSGINYFHVKHVCVLHFQLENSIMQQLPSLCKLPSSSWSQQLLCQGSNPKKKKFVSSSGNQQVRASSPALPRSKS